MMDLSNSHLFPGTLIVFVSIIHTHHWFYNCSSRNLAFWTLSWAAIIFQPNQLSLPRFIEANELTWGISPVVWSVDTCIISDPPLEQLKLSISWYIQVVHKLLIQIDSNWNWQHISYSIYKITLRLERSWLDVLMFVFPSDSFLAQRLTSWHLTTEWFSSFIRDDKLAGGAGFRVITDQDIRQVLKLPIKEPDKLCMGFTFLSVLLESVRAVI